MAPVLASALSLAEGWSAGASALRRSEASASGFARGQPDAGAGCRQPEHGARVAAMGGDGLAALKRDIGKEALVVPDQPAAVRWEGNRMSSMQATLGGWRTGNKPVQLCDPQHLSDVFLKC